jgi:Siphovirus Gp157
MTSTALTLYQIADDYLADAQRLADLDLDQQTMLDTLEGMSGAVETKALSVAACIRNLEATADAIRDAEKQMAARRKALENRADAIREYLRVNMLRCEITEISCPHFTLKIKKNPPVVVVDIPEMLPFDMWNYPETPPKTPDKNAIKEALGKGEDVPGVHLEQSTRLEIK